MTRRPDQASGARSEVPQEYAELADRVAKHFSAQSFDPAVRARHLHRLRELAAAEPLPSAARGHVGSRWRGLGRHVVGTVAASLAVVTLGTPALAAASLSALPGEPLYGTKRLVERVQLAAALTREGEVVTLVGQAQRRIQEVHLLVKQGAAPELVATALGTFEQQLRKAEELAGDDQGLKQQVAEMAGGAAEQLGELKGRMPGLDQDARQAVVVAREAATASAAADRPNRRQAPAPGGSGEPASPAAPQPPKAAAEPEPEPGPVEGDPVKGTVTSEPATDMGAPPGVPPGAPPEVPPGAPPGVPPGVPADAAGPRDQADRTVTASGTASPGPEVPNPPLPPFPNEYKGEAVEQGNPEEQAPPEAPPESATARTPRSR